MKKKEIDWAAVGQRIEADKKLITAYFENPTPENKEKIKHIRFVKPEKLL